MSDAHSQSPSTRVIGGLMLLVGLSVFAIRLQHPGPYDPPEGGNLVGGVLALLIGGVLASGFLSGSGTVGLLRRAMLAATPFVLFLALYATFAELEEVVVLNVRDDSGSLVPLRLWIVDRDGAPWVYMPGPKADANGLSTGARVELLRDGTPQCVIAARHEDHATVSEIHHLRHQKYAVQRLAEWVGLFGDDAGETTVALRLDPCTRS